MTPEELDLVSTNDLMAALARRSSVAVVATLRPMKNGGEEDFETVVNWSGGSIQAFGLAKYATDYIAKRFSFNCEPVNDE